MASPSDAFLDAGFAWNHSHRISSALPQAHAFRNNSGWMLLILAQASLVDYLNLFDTTGKAATRTSTDG